MPSTAFASSLEWNNSVLQGQVCYIQHPQMGIGTDEYVLRRYQQILSPRTRAASPFRCPDSVEQGA